jgi:hypothetical protein
MIIGRLYSKKVVCGSQIIESINPEELVLIEKENLGEERVGMPQYDVISQHVGT